MELDGVNISDVSDADLTERMRKCNYEKFKSLVRMHLSFELDLNTDEFDLPCHEIVYEDKGKLKKWNRLSKKHKHSSTGTTGCTASVKGFASAGSSPTEGLYQQIDPGFLFHLNELKEYLLMEQNITQEGIFRKTGSVARQNELRLLIQNEKPLNLDSSIFSAHDCATVFKSYLADLPEPLLTDAHYPAHLQIAPLCTANNNKKSETLNTEKHLLSSMQFLLLLLPEENRNLLKHIIEILQNVVTHENANKMSADNLATLFSPHLICPRNLPPEALHYLAMKLSSIISYMILKGIEIFDVPAKLSTDIRAYFLERKRKKTMSPEQTLDESISDLSTVNTVYTFVDREKTAAAHTKNTTDTELAQLYAHIQSLPESSKKRRLIKQFNKQNGQGTPLQLVLMNRLRNSEASRSAKSISDSIKKHIFHKGIMSRTPKRTAAANIVGESTPILTNAKNPKLRVLFQSPIPTATAGMNTTPTTPSASSYTFTNTPNTTRSHQLEKSVSSLSLHLNSTTSSRNSYKQTLNVDHESNSTSSSIDGFYQKHLIDNKASYSISAPVSRQTSKDLISNTSTSISNSAHSCSNHSTNSNSPLIAAQPSIVESSCCMAHLKLLSDAAKQLINVGGDKKTVAWQNDQLHEIEELAEESNACLSSSHNTSELKYRYKSAPNLSQVDIENVSDIIEQTPFNKTGKSLTRKLMKGVSMGNLKFPFHTPETTKRIVRSVSATLKRRSSDSTPDCAPYGKYGATCTIENTTITTPLLSNVHDIDLDDETFEDDPQDQLDSESGSDLEIHKTAISNDDECSRSSNSLNDLPTAGYKRQLPVASSCHYRNLDLMISTPANLLGRRSMSPITKSTQRMPKAMQESIMTPRSRKPVMVLTTTLGGSSDQNQTIYQSDLSSFREQDEDDTLSSRNSGQKQLPTIHSEDATTGDTFTDLIKRQQLKQTNQKRITHTDTECSTSSSSSNGQKTDTSNTQQHNALTDNFKEYLLSRSVLTASPVDSSFSSQSDDFSSTQDIEDLEESKLSPSLLYCLDGNEPDNENKMTVFNDCTTQATSSCLTDTITALSSSNSSNRLTSSNPIVINNNVRKRAATNVNEQLYSTVSDPNTSPTPSYSKKAQLTNKENYKNVHEYIQTKKILFSSSEFPGETSF